MVKQKLKPLLPSLREKKRYLVFEIISKNKIKDFEMVSKTIIETSLRYLGEFTTGQAGIIFLSDKWNPKLQRGVMRVNHKCVNKIKSVLTLIDNVGEEQVIVKSVGVSGILKKAEERYLKTA